MLNPALDRRPLSRRAVALTAALPACRHAAGRGVPRRTERARRLSSGSVYDATGAVLPGVAMTLEDATQRKFQAVTNAAGRFEFSNVQPGRYVLAASLPGFRALRQEFDLQSAPATGTARSRCRSAPCRKASP